MPIDDAGSHGGVDLACFVGVSLLFVVCGKHQSAEVDEQHQSLFVGVRGLAQVAFRLIEHALPFALTVVEIGARDGCLATVVNLHKGLMDKCQSRVAQHEADAQFPIAPFVEIFVPPSVGFKIFSPDGIALGGKNAVENVVGKHIGGEVGEGATFALAVATHFHQHGIQSFGMLHDGAVVLLHQGGVHGIVAVEKHKPFALRSTQSGVARCRSGVFLFLCDHHLKIFGGMRPLKLAEHLQRVVGAVIIHQHHLQRAVGLRQHRMEGGLHLL